MRCLVAKRNNTVQTRKQRDYPWANLAEFLSSDQTPDGTLAGTNASVIEDIIQTRLEDLWTGVIGVNTNILDQVPLNGFHQSYVVGLERFLKKMEESTDFYNQCGYHRDAGNDEFFGTAEFISFKQTCLVVRIDLPQFALGFTFMLRPFIFPHQTGDLWHAGSFYVHTESNPRGWFYQMKYQIIK